MKSRTEQLLDDLVEDVAPPAFRGAVLQGALKQARRRRHVRALSLAAGVAAGIVMVVFVLWKPTPVEPVTSANPVPATALVVFQSQPLRPSQIVQSENGSLTWVASSGSTLLTTIQTDASRLPYLEISDQQLLGLFAGRRVTLVRHGPGDAELIFSNPEDQKELIIP